MTKEMVLKAKKAKVLVIIQQVSGSLVCYFNPFLYTDEGSGGEKEDEIRF
ncbi:hypothetical protein [Albibacterium indicum]|nr:hypothetical protein [Pedobacter indicus]